MEPLRRLVVDHPPERQQEERLCASCCCGGETPRAILSQSGLLSSSLTHWEQVEVSARWRHRCGNLVISLKATRKEQNAHRIQRADLQQRLTASALPAQPFGRADAERYSTRRVARGIALSGTRRRQYDVALAHDLFRPRSQERLRQIARRMPSLPDEQMTDCMPEPRAQSRGYAVAGITLFRLAGRSALQTDHVPTAHAGARSARRPLLPAPNLHFP